MSVEESNLKLYGIVARFSTPEELVAAAERTRDAGYTMTDAHVPFPVHGLSEALGMPRSKLASLVLVGGTLGALGGFALQYWVSAVTYPINVGGRPFFSWPSFIPVIFECTILGAALTTIISMIALNKLPQPYHPVFNTPGFERASRDGFYLSIEAVDPNFDKTKTHQFLESLQPVEIHDVEP